MKCPGFILKGGLFSQIFYKKNLGLFSCREKKNASIKDQLPTAILYLVKIHDSSFLEILQRYHKVYFLLTSSRFNLSNIQEFGFQKLF